MELVGVRGNHTSYSLFVNGMCIRTYIVLFIIQKYTILIFGFCKLKRNSKHLAYSCHGRYVFPIVAVTDGTCSLSSLSRKVRVSYRRCHGRYVFPIVAVTGGACSLAYSCHGWYMFPIVVVTDDWTHSHGRHNLATFVISVKILATVRLGFRVCQFNVGRCGDG
jgi:hypothetical protein